MQLGWLHAWNLCQQNYHKYAQVFSLFFRRIANIAMYIILRKHPRIKLLLFTESSFDKYVFC